MEVNVRRTVTIVLEEEEAKVLWDTLLYRGYAPGSWQESLWETLGKELGL